MAKIFVVLCALLVVPCIVTARFVSNPLRLQGSVLCDTCQCGYETTASTSISGAIVRVECRNRQTSKITYTKEAVTDSTGHYEMIVHGDRGDDFCDTVLVKSSDPECNRPGEGRDRARVILTRNNGMNSNIRFANPMLFVKKTALASCPKILLQYQETDESD